MSSLIGPDANEVRVSDMGTRENSTEEEVRKGIGDDEMFQMMVKLGYRSSPGKSKQHVQAQIDRGNVCDDVSKRVARWDAKIEEVNVQEDVQWLENRNEDELSYETLSSWKLVGQPLTRIDDETEFVDGDLLKRILKAKEIFNELDPVELSRARTRANSFETIRCAFFMNRAALKMANVDAATGFMFTEIDRHPDHRTPNGPYYFADVCAGPGGFTEYVLWRKKWSFKGFGFTLKGEHDFRLHDSTCASKATFQSYYGSNGDGDICNPGNIQDFAEKVLHQSDGVGVHFMMSDGGFSVEGNENLQEVLSKQLYVCQCLLALEIVRSKGHFVTKLFDLYTIFSVGLIFLMRLCFEQVTVLKPNTSRPANSERYLVCKSLKGTKQTAEIRKYLRKIVEDLWRMREDRTDVDITAIVPLNVLKSDEEFYEYIVDSNNQLGRRQKVGLLKLAAFCRNSHLTEPRQEMLRTRCLSYWRIPDRPRAPSTKFTLDDLLSISVYNSDFMLVQPREVTNMEGLKKIVSDVTEWNYVLLTSSMSANACNFYAGVGDSKVYKLQGNKWIKVKRMRLARGTLLYGELVQEECVSSSDRYQQKSLHIIDALYLGEVSLADLPFDERLNCVQTYCRAANFECVPNNVRIRPKIVEPLGSLCTNGAVTYDDVMKRYVSSLPPLGLRSVIESYRVNSILLLKPDSNQSFSSTYVLRVQVFVNDEFSRDFVSLEEITKYIRNEFVLDL